MSIAQNAAYKLDLSHGTSVINLTTPLVEGDDRAQTFRIELLERGKPADLSSCGCTAFFCRGSTKDEEADTIPVPGTVYGNVATVTLTESCYSRSCYFSMPIRLTNANTGQKRTFMIVRGTVVKSVDGKIIDPDGSVPTIDEIFAQIAVMERARQAAEEATAEALDAANKANEAREEFRQEIEDVHRDIDRYTATPVIPTATGDVVSISDSASRPLVAMRVFGWTSQPGKPSLTAPAQMHHAGSSGSVTVSVDGNGSLSVATPNGLPGIPVASGGNYSNASGQEWICDEVDFGSGVYVQRIARYILDGSTPPNGYTNVYGYMRFEWTGDGFEHAPLDYTKTELQMCNSFVPSTAPLELNGVNGAIATYSSGGIFLRYDGASSISEMAAYLARNPVEYMYVMDTPIEIPLSDAELEAFANLYSHYPSTTIRNSVGAFMAVSYIADTKNYIDGKLAALGIAVSDGEDGV